MLLTEIAVGEDYSGQLAHALPLYRKAIELWRQDDSARLIRAAALLAASLCLASELATAERETRQALLSAHWYPDANDYDRAVLRFSLARTLGIRGRLREVDRVLPLVVSDDEKTMAQVGAVPSIELARLALRRGQLDQVRVHARSAQEVAIKYKNHKLQSEALMLLAMAAMRLGDLGEAEQLLHESLRCARDRRLLTEETAGLLGFAQLHHRRGEPEAARQLLNDVLELAEQGSHRLLKAEALNLLTTIERHASRPDAAAVAAADAYRTAWCDGPPFAYQDALDEARDNLAALGAAPRELPPFEVEVGLDAARPLATDDPDPEVRATALQWIAFRWVLHPATLPLVQRLATDPAKQVRQAAVATLAAGWPETFTTVTDSVKTSESDR